MLTFRETDLIVAAELDKEYNIRKRIFFTEPRDKPAHKHNEQTDQFTCGYCDRTVKRKDTFRNHLKLCTARVIMEKIGTNDFKQFVVNQEDHRLELMMPYNHERGLRMYISGPPRCGKSHLVGQIIREYVRHNPKRKIYLFSQVETDRAIDNVIDDIVQNLDWPLEQFIRIDLNKFMNADIKIDEFRGKTNKRTLMRHGSL